MQSLLFGTASQFLANLRRTFDGWPVFLTGLCSIVENVSLFMCHEINTVMEY